MNKVLHGVVHGKTIELSEPAGVADGQEVEVVVRFSCLPVPGARAFAIRPAAGPTSGPRKTMRFWSKSSRIEAGTRPQIPPQ